MDEILVEILARIFCGFAEVEVWDIPWAFVEDKVEEGIQSSQFLAQFVGSDILGMNYLGVVYTMLPPIIVSSFYHKAENVVWKTMHK